MFNKLTFELCIVGTVSFIGGLLTEYYLKKNNKNNMLSKIKNNNRYKFYIYLLLFGVSFHLLIEYFGINQWQCKKICYNNQCKYICYKKI